MNLILSRENTYLFYIIIYIISICLLILAKKIKSSKIVNFLFFVVVSMLFCIIAFRTVGIDRQTYIEIYEYIPYYRENYTLLVMEPFYFALNLIAYYIFKSYVFIQIFQGAIYAISIFYILKYCKEKRLNTVIVYAFTIGSMFFYMMGLVRMCIAVSTFTICFVEYLKKTNLKLLITGIIIAGGFHYSAIIIGFIFIFLFVLNNQKRIKHIIFYVGYVFPILLFILLKIFNSFLVSRLGLSKYAGYLDVHFNIMNLKGIIYILPLIFLYFFWGDRGKSMDVLFKKQMAIIIVISHLSCFFNGAFRFSFYINIFVGILYAIYFKKRIIVPQYVVEIIFVIVMSVYPIPVFFDSPYITHLIVPFAMKF